MADAEVARAVVTIVPTMEGSRGAISEQITDVLGGAGGPAGEKIGGGLLDGLGGILGGKLGPLLAGVLSTATVAAVGKALLDVGAQFDEMSDAIVIGTGASGAALEGLESVANNLATSLPVSFGDAGSIVADLNTRLGLTGDELETLASKVATLGTFGEQIDINTMTGAFNAFGIEAADVANHMDYLWGVSQATGVGMNDLFSTLQKGAPQLTALGFSVEESANLIGLLDKNGLNASTMMGSLSKALVNLAEPGQSAQDAFRGALDQLQGFIDAGDEAAALDLASQLFGTKQATAFVAAVKNGTLSLDELGDMALGAAGDIAGTFEQTESWPEKWEVLKNKFAAAVEPMASFLFDGLGAAVDFITGAFEKFAEWAAPIVQPVADAFHSLGEALAPIVAQWLPPLQQIGAAVGGLLAGMFQTLMQFVGFILPYIQSFLEWIGPYVTPVLQFIADGVTGLIGLFGEQSGALEGLQATIETVGNVFEVVATAIDLAWNALVGFFKSIPSTIVNAFSSFGASLQAKFEAAKTLVIGVAENIVSFWSSIPSRIINFFSDIGSRIGEAFANIKLPRIGVEGSWNPADWVENPANIPHLTISWAAQGGIVDGATLIGAGEAGREAIVPLEHPEYMRPFAQAVATELGDGGAFAQIVELLQIIAAKNPSIEVDGREFSRALSPYMNAQIGNRAVLAARGVS